jgi:hypothetical protein
MSARGVLPVAYAIAVCSKHFVEGKISVLFSCALCAIKLPNLCYNIAHGGTSFNVLSANNEKARFQCEDIYFSMLAERRLEEVQPQAIL